jgi:type I restriction enzyme R subunit
MRSALPHASFIGFTATPIEAGDRSTPAVFGDYIDVYDIQRAVEDGATVRIFYEGRLIAQDIVCNEPQDLRGWHDDDDDKGEIKIVMTGSASDPLDWQPHIRNKPRREQLALRFKDPDDSFKVVIVRDMWLTGFDVPCLHTMYVDKPMQGHGLTRGRQLRRLCPIPWTNRAV